MRVKILISILIILSANFVSPLFALDCSEPKFECVESGGTRNIEGVDVTLECWKYKTTYECRDNLVNNCQELRNQGCRQVKAECKSFIKGVCTAQVAIYSCPTADCKKEIDREEINCAKDLFCIDGNCANKNPTKNNKFGKAATHLAALMEAAEEVKKQNVKNPLIFSGKRMECSKNIAGAKNCCKDYADGWLEGVILNCGQEERDLAKLKAEGRAIEVGEYCYNRVAKVCTSRHVTYCVFDSKIARIVQHDGRRKQLGIGFGQVGGDSANLDCRGVTADELSKMDFNKIDFRDLYIEFEEKAKKNMPAANVLRERVLNQNNNDLLEKSTENLGFSQGEFNIRVADRMKDHLKPK